MSVEEGPNTHKEDSNVNVQNLNTEEQLDLQATRSPALTLAQQAEQDAKDNPPSSPSFPRRLVLSIRRVAADMQLPQPQCYEYEEWVEFTRQIRFTQNTAGEHGEGVLEEVDEEGLVDRDRIGSNSPLMSGLSESEWLLNKLCESLLRLERMKEVVRRSDWDGNEVKGVNVTTNGREMVSGMGMGNGVECISASKRVCNF